ncbi:MAG: hypothetical protein ACPGMR_03440 [Pontibacterium sp.]
MSERYKKGRRIDGHPIAHSGVEMDEDAVLKRLHYLQDATDQMSEIIEAVANKLGVKSGNVSGLIDAINGIKNSDDHFWVGDVARRLPIEMLPKTQSWSSLLSAITQLKTQRNNLLDEVGELERAIKPFAEAFEAARKTHELKDMIVDAIYGKGCGSMERAIEAEKSGLAEFTGNQHNLNWEWKKEELKKLDENELLKLYMEI